MDPPLKVAITTQTLVSRLQLPTLEYGSQDLASAQNLICSCTSSISLGYAATLAPQGQPHPK
jgi:hypothetical protein